MKTLILVLAGLLFAASVARAQQVFTNEGNAHLVQSLTFHPPQIPFGPTDFGSVDIVFANGVERLGVGLESDILLIDDNFGPAFPHCTCEAFDDVALDSPLSRDYFVAYYFSQADPPFGQLFDGLLIRQKGDHLCVNSIRKTTFPANFVTVFEEHDCLEAVAIIGPTPTELGRLKRLLEEIELPPSRIPPIKWPEPFCLTCPPWSKYVKQRAKYAAIHEAHVREQLTGLIQASKELMERK
jgi:hypothetical protein